MTLKKRQVLALYVYKPVLLGFTKKQRWLVVIFRLLINFSSDNTDNSRSLWIFISMCTLVQLSNNWIKETPPLSLTFLTVQKSPDRTCTCSDHGGTVELEVFFFIPFALVSFMLCFKMNGLQRASVHVCAYYILLDLYVSLAAITLISHQLPLAPHAWEESQTTGTSN